MKLAQVAPNGKVLVTNSKKLSVDLPKDLLVYKKLSHLQRLQKLHALTLSGEREKADLMLLFKCMLDVNSMVNSTYLPRRTMNAVCNSGFTLINHAQRQSVHYLNIMESMNGTTYHLIPTVVHQWQFLDVQFLMIYLIYYCALLNFYFVYISCRPIPYY